MRVYFRLILVVCDAIWVRMNSNLIRVVRVPTSNGNLRLVVRIAYALLRRQINKLRLWSGTLQSCLNCLFLRLNISFIKGILYSSHNFKSSVKNNELETIVFLNVVDMNILYVTLKKKLKNFMGIKETEYWICRNR